MTGTRTERQSKKTSKGEQTRARIVDAALALFRDHGYEQMTMRAVAERAGVSLGNAYYYFKSKEHLLHAYYDFMSKAQAEAAEASLHDERDFEARLRGALVAKLEVIEPYHRFAGLLFKTAADPRSPLNPFHPTSAAVREQELALYRRVFEGSKVKVPKDLAEELPMLLWMHSMGIVLFWIYDESDGRARTRVLVDHTARLIARLVKLASNPLLRPLRKSTIQLLRDLQLAAG